MVEGIDGPVEGLVEEQVVQVVAAALQPDASPPDAAQHREDQPGAPAPGPSEFAQAPLEAEPDKNAQQRQEESHGSLTENGGKDREAESPAQTGAPVAAVNFPEDPQGQREEEGHEHVHPEHHGPAQEKGGGQQRRFGGNAPGQAKLLSAPAFEDPKDAEGR